MDIIHINNKCYNNQNHLLLYFLALIVITFFSRLFIRQFFPIIFFFTTIKTSSKTSSNQQDIFGFSYNKQIIKDPVGCSNLTSTRVFCKNTEKKGELIQISLKLKATKHHSVDRVSVLCFTFSVRSFSFKQILVTNINNVIMAFKLGLNHFQCHTMYLNYTTYSILQNVFPISPC